VCDVRGSDDSCTDRSAGLRHAGSKGGRVRVGAGGTESSAA